METTSRFQSRLLALAKKSRRQRSPLSLLNKMEGRIRRVFLQVDGDEKIAFIGGPRDFVLLRNWIFLSAALAGVDLGLAVRTKYPGFCPYCGSIKCQCGNKKDGPHQHWEGPLPAEGTISDLQQMLVMIYPPERHTLERHVEKVLEEIQEAREVIQKSLLMEIRNELADILAWLLPLAKMLNMPLA